MIALVTFLAIRVSSSDAYGMRRSIVRACRTVSGQLRRAPARTRGRAHPLRQRAIVGQARASRAPIALGRGLADESVDAVLDELGRTARVAAGDHRLARRERLDGDEAVVLLERRKHDGAARRELRDQLRRRVSRPANVTRLATPSSDASRSSAGRSSPSPRDHDGGSRHRRRGERANQQVRALQASQPRDEEERRPVADPQR